MGYRLAKFEVCPKENEQLEITVRLPKERRSVIHGVVRDCNDDVIENAVVKLFELTNPCDLCSMKALTHTFTDECGQFIFGPVSPNRRYIIKVWYDDVKIVAMTVKPNKDSKHCAAKTDTRALCTEEIIEDEEY